MTVHSKYVVRSTLNEYTVKHIISMVNEKKITKPEFQRLIVWTNHPEKEGKSSFREFISFLMKAPQSCQIVTVIRNKDGSFKLIDGSNRINAILIHEKSPFLLFPELIEPLIHIINYELHISNTQKERMVNEFKKMSHSEFSYLNNKKMKSKYPDPEPNSTETNSKICLSKEDRNKLIECIEDIQDNMKVDGNPFDVIVKFPFREYDECDEMYTCELFIDMNKHHSKMEKRDMIAALLHATRITQLKDNNGNDIHGTFIADYNEHHERRFRKDSISCVPTNTLTGYKFLVVTEIHGHRECLFMPMYNEKFGIYGESNDSHSIPSKVWEIINDSKGPESYTNENAQLFYDKFMNAVRIFNKSCLAVFVDRELYTNSPLSANVISVLLCQIIGNVERGLSLNTIQTDVCRFILTTVTNAKTTLSRKTAGDLYTGLSKKHYKGNYTVLNGDEIRASLKIHAEAMKGQVNTMKTIYMAHFKKHIPNTEMPNTFQNDHIVPQSSKVADNDEIEAQTINIHRLGNLFPIGKDVNNKRKNKHPKDFYDKPYMKKFTDFELYDKCVSHECDIPSITDACVFDEMCSKLEFAYIDIVLNDTI